MAKERSYRFLTEYANEKMERVLRYGKTFPETEKAMTEKARHIDRIYWNARNGLITLDEAMKLIAET